MRGKQPFNEHRDAGGNAVRQAFGGASDRIGDGIAIPWAAVMVQPLIIGQKTAAKELPGC